MENLVPLGTGNSRFMKSNISPNTTLAQLIQMLNNGTFPYDIGPINPAGISQQGTPLNKDTLLAALVAQKLGGVETPSEAFDLLSQLIMAGKYVFSVKVKTADGAPVSGVRLTGIQDVSGTSGPLTNAEGLAFGISESESVSISIESYWDVTAGSVSAQGIMGTAVSVPDLTATLVNFRSFTASTTGKLSGACTRLDVSLCSAGAGGGGGEWANNYADQPSGGDVGSASGGKTGYGGVDYGGGAGGGASGGVLVQENVPFSPQQEYSINVGKGGDGGDPDETQSALRLGQDGGVTTAFGLNAGGGRNGEDGSNYRATTPVRGGAGGDGADAGASGNNQIYSSFTAMKTCGLGGDGAPYQQEGVSAGNGKNGTAPGGGGGGGAGQADSSKPTKGGNGADGEVAIRMWHGEEAS